MFRDYRNLKSLDSRLRGNDGTGIAYFICYIGKFQTTFPFIRAG